MFFFGQDNLFEFVAYQTCSVTGWFGQACLDFQKKKDDMPYMPCPAETKGVARRFTALLWDETWSM